MHFTSKILYLLFVLFGSLLDLQANENTTIFTNTDEHYSIELPNQMEEISGFFDQLFNFPSRPYLRAFSPSVAKGWKYFDGKLVISSECGHIKSSTNLSSLFDNVKISLEQNRCSLIASGDTVIGDKESKWWINVANQLYTQYGFLVIGEYDVHFIVFTTHNLDPSRRQSFEKIAKTFIALK